MSAGGGRFCAAREEAGPSFPWPVLAAASGMVLRGCCCRAGARSRYGAASNCCRERRTRAERTQNCQRHKPITRRQSGSWQRCRCGGRARGSPGRRPGAHRGYCEPPGVPPALGRANSGRRPGGPKQRPLSVACLGAAASHTGDRGRWRSVGAAARQPCRRRSAARWA